ncbi:MAG: hypothetical protein OXO51_17590, partial [Gemmatimonadota bacterium]|nr:hypothetical protein [Gemmatimonadota bacterium]
HRTDSINPVTPARPFLAAGPVGLVGPGGFASRAGFEGFAIPDSFVFGRNLLICVSPRIAGGIGFCIFDTAMDYCTIVQLDALHSRYATPACDAPCDASIAQSIRYTP